MDLCNPWLDDPGCPIFATLTPNNQEKETTKPTETNRNQCKPIHPKTKTELNQSKLNKTEQTVKQLNS